MTKHIDTFAYSGMAVCLRAMMALSCVAWPAHAIDVGIDGGGGNYNVPVRSILDQRFEDVSRQQYDYSCGSAAIATLLTRFYDYPISEKEALSAMYAVGNQEKIKREGFSLLDMKIYLNSIGFRADGYRDSLDKLKRVNIPAIALVNSNGYHHFVVISGVTDDSVMLLDSARGKRIVRRNDFERDWNRILFIIRNEMTVAKKTFNNSRSWAAHRQARFNTPMNTEDLVSTALQNAYTPGYF